MSEIAGDKETDMPIKINARYGVKERDICKRKETIKRHSNKETDRDRDRELNKQRKNDMDRERDMKRKTNN